MHGVEQLREFDADDGELAYELVERGVSDVYVLTNPDGQVELYETSRKEALVFAYTSVGLRVAACGGGQPARKATTARLVRWAGSTGLPIVFAVDARHPEGVRYPEPDVRTLEPLPPVPRIPRPTELWIASRPLVAGAAQAELELYSETPGSPMLLAYETPEELHECCGPHQAAISIDPDLLDDVTDAAGAVGVLFGAELSEELRHQAPVVDWKAHDHFS